MWPFRDCGICCQTSFPLKQKLCSSLDNYHWAVPTPEILPNQVAPPGAEIYIYNHLPSPKMLVFRTKLHTCNLGIRSALDLNLDLPMSSKETYKRKTAPLPFLRGYLEGKYEKELNSWNIRSMIAFVVPCDLFFWNFAIAQMSRLFFICSPEDSPDSRETRFSNPSGPLCLYKQNQTHRGPNIWPNNRSSQATDT